MIPGEWYDEERPEPEDEVKSGIDTHRWLPSILRSVEIDRQMEAWTRQFFHLPNFLPGKSKGLTLGDEARILNNGYPDEAE